LTGLYGIYNANEYETLYTYNVFKWRVIRLNNKIITFISDYDPGGDGTNTYYCVKDYCSNSIDLNNCFDVTMFREYGVVFANLQLYKIKD
jgi:hypothetical protein